MTTNDTLDEHRSTVSNHLNYIGDDILSQRRHAYRHDDMDNADALLETAGKANDALDTIYDHVDNDEYMDARKHASVLKRHLDRLERDDRLLDAERYEDRIFELRVSLEMLDILA